MKHWKIRYWERVVYEVEVEAETPNEAIARLRRTDIIEEGGTIPEEHLIDSEVGGIYAVAEVVYDEDGIEVVPSGVEGRGCSASS